MLTIEKLEEYGVNTKEGLGRCMNNEKFYMRMIGMGLKNASFDKLAEKLATGDFEGAFEEAHALKGVVGNLALTPLYKPLAEMTEKLRHKEAGDYISEYEPVKALRDKMLSEL